MNVVVPLIVAYALVSFLADPSHSDTAELLRNSILINTQSFSRPSDPVDALAVAIRSSAILFASALALAVSLGLPIGIAYGWAPRGRWKPALWAAGTLGATLPAFFWAIVLELVIVGVYFRFGVRLLPIAGYGLDEHLILPSLALAIRPAAYMFRLISIAVEEIRRTDYVRTARAKGLAGRRLLIRHVVPNAAPSIIAAILLSARGALSSLAIVEFVYVWDGAGLAFLQALGHRSLGLAGAIALVFALASALLIAAANAARARVPTPR